jgi:hypothetical protein
VLLNHLEVNQQLDRLDEKHEFGRFSKNHFQLGLNLVRQGKSKKAKGKRKKANILDFSAILNGSFISAELY